MDLRHWRSPRVVLGTAAVLLAGAALAGCGASSKASSAASAVPASPAASQAGRQAGRSATPGAFGTAAAISGSTIQVQDPATGQVSVTFTEATRFALTRAVTSAALKVGDCVSAVGVRAAGTPASATPAPSASASPGAPKDFAAASVSISTAVDGSCSVAGGGGFGGGGFGGRPSGTPTRTRPSGAPSGGFEGGFGGAGFGDFASGRLTALTPTSMSVQVLDRQTNATGTDTVTLTPTTSYSQTATVPSTALRVGQCVAATGPANTKGAIAATRITLSTAGPNGCSAGFGRRGGAGASTAPTGG